MTGTIDYELSAHAATVMAEREILESWVVRVPSDPERTEQDATDPMLRHALRRISERRPGSAGGLQ
jgi:hypothetical protein